MQHCEFKLLFHDVMLEGVQEVIERTFESSISLLTKKELENPQKFINSLLYGVICEVLIGQPVSSEIQACMLLIDEERTQMLECFDKHVYQEEMTAKNRELVIKYLEQALHNRRKFSGDFRTVIDRLDEEVSAHDVHREVLIQVMLSVLCNTQLVCLVLHWTILYLINNPDQMYLVQEELDRVFGPTLQHLLEDERQSYHNELESDDQKSTPHKISSLSSESTSTIINLDDMDLIYSSPCRRIRKQSLEKCISVYHQPEVRLDTGSRLCGRYIFI